MPDEEGRLTIEDVDRAADQVRIAEDRRIQEAYNRAVDALRQADAARQGQETAWRVPRDVPDREVVPNMAFTTGNTVLTATTANAADFVPANNLQVRCADGTNFMFPAIWRADPNNDGYTDGIRFIGRNEIENMTFEQLDQIVFPEEYEEDGFNTEYELDTEYVFRLPDSAAESDNNNIERRTTMEEQQIRLQVHEVITALGLYRSDNCPNGVIVAQDIGNHAFCLIDTNCPEAVKLRKMLDEAGITVEQLTQHYMSRRPDPPPEPFRFPPTLDISGKTMVNVMGKQVEVDIGSHLKDQIMVNMERRYHDFVRQDSMWRGVAKDLYRNYIYAHEDARRLRSLPQVQLQFHEMMKYRCSVTWQPGYDNCYWYCFPFHYAPEYLHSRGDKWRINAEQQKQIAQEVIVVFFVYQNKEMGAPALYSTNGRKFIHYHGGSADCWGDHRHMRKWDGKLATLAKYVQQLEAMSKTLNKDSLAQSAPVGLPTYVSLEKNAIYLGKEGEYKEGDAAKDIDTEEQPKNVSSEDAWGGGNRG